MSNACRGRLYGGALAGEAGWISNATQYRVGPAERLVR